ncbi:MAG TPA: hypothetical protein GXX55_04305 [Firmicutes bacterium]|nr:hypothetical protein [Bacillota bacterium]
MALVIAIIRPLFFSLSPLLTSGLSPVPLLGLGLFSYTPEEFPRVLDRDGKSLADAFGQDVAPVQGDQDIGFRLGRPGQYVRVFRGN